MTKLMLAITSATALAAAPAFGAPNADTFQPDSFENLSDVFEAADLDENSQLSRDEYQALVVNTVDDRWVQSYRGDDWDRAGTTIERAYSQLDADDDGTVSLTEFMNVANDPLAQNRADADRFANQSWDPEYITVTYYLTANEIPTEEITGQPVVNLQGEPVGNIEYVIHTNDENRYYAIMDIVGTSMDRTPAVVPPERVGIPLNDLLIYEDGRSIMLSTRGEQYLRNAEDRELDMFEPIDYVDTIYS